MSDADVSRAGAAWLRRPAGEPFPPPPEGTAGWPWHTESAGVGRMTVPAGGCPRITIVTPSYNQGEFLEETIRSVLLQGYPNLEYLVIDGGSSDNSVEIIRKYEPWLAYWVSERDRGQSHAINKGFDRATGDIVAWLNSDDIYFPGVLAHVADRYLRSEADRFWLVTGVDYYIEGDGGGAPRFQPPFNGLTEWFSGEAQLNQQGAFWSGAIQRRAGPLDEVMQYGFDREFFVRLLSLGYRYDCSTDIVGARYRIHDQCKTRVDFRRENPRTQYEWTQAALRYLSPDLPEYAAVRRDLRKSMAFLRSASARIGAGTGWTG